MSVLGFDPTETKGKPTREKFEDIFMDKVVSSQLAIENAGIDNHEA